MSLIFAVMGLIVLLLGQRLFWLALAALTWVSAMDFLGHPLESLGELAVLLIAVILAIIAGVIGRSRGTVATALGGFLSASLTISLVAELARLELGAAFWPVVLVTGVVGILVCLRFRPLGSIVLLSIAGAAILPVSFELQKEGGLTGWLVFIILAVAGFFAQSRVLRAAAPSPGAA